MKKTKIALITGSSDGLGAGIAKVLGANEYTIVVTYLSNKEKAEHVASLIKNNGGEAVIQHLDVTSEESVQQCMAFIEKTFGGLDVLVNNAGVDQPSPIETCTFAQWQAITRSKIDGNFLCTKYALPLLKRRDKSDVICIMSSLGDRPDPEDAPYSVGTAGVVAFVKSMAVALAKYGIRTNGVGAGAARTNLDYWKGKTDKDWENLAKDNPLGRVTTPEDVGETVLAIVENKTQYWNGSFLYVSGGEHLK